MIHLDGVFRFFVRNAYNNPCIIIIVHVSLLSLLIDWFRLWSDSKTMEFWILERDTTDRLMIDSMMWIILPTFFFCCCCYFFFVSSFDRRTRSFASSCLRGTSLNTTITNFMYFSIYFFPDNKWEILNENIHIGFCPSDLNTIQIRQPILMDARSVVVVDLVAIVVVFVIWLLIFMSVLSFRHLYFCWCFLTFFFGWLLLIKTHVRNTIRIKYIYGRSTLPCTKN